MRCAVPEDAWPLPFGLAALVADRIGVTTERFTPRQPNQMARLREQIALQQRESGAL